MSNIETTILIHMSNIESTILIHMLNIETTIILNTKANLSYPYKI